MQQLPTGVYTFWPRGPGGKAAVLSTEIKWDFQPDDVGTVLSFLDKDSCSRMLLRFTSVAGLEAFSPFSHINVLPGLTPADCRPK